LGWDTDGTPVNGPGSPGPRAVTRVGSRGATASLCRMEGKLEVHGAPVGVRRTGCPVRLVLFPPGSGCFFFSGPGAHAGRKAQQIRGRGWRAGGATPDGAVPGPRKKLVEDGARVPGTTGKGGGRRGGAARCPLVQALLFFFVSRAAGERRPGARSASRSWSKKFRHSQTTSCRFLLRGGPRPAGLERVRRFGSWA